ncbi:MAG: hypothetical protein ACHQ2F_10255 [Desulfobaccales bacterium]
MSRGSLTQREGAEAAFALGGTHKTSWLLLAMILAVFWTLGVSPAAAQGPGAGPLLEKPQPSSELPGPGEKKEEAPTTCGPLISDSCLPIEEHHASVQVKPFLLYSNIWLNTPVNMFKLNGSDFPQAVRNRENVTFNLAAEYPLAKQWVLLLEMYSTWTWSNPGTETLGFESPTTVVGFLPGVEFVANEKWSFSAGCAFDTFGKFGGHKVTPALTAYYSF